MMSGLRTLSTVLATVGCFGLLGAMTAPAGADPGPSPTPKSCSGSAYAPPFSGKYGKPGQANTAVAGHPGYRQGYSVTVAGDVGHAAVQIKGYTPQGKPFWKGIGAANSGDTLRGSVYWGNGLAMPAVRAAAPASPGVFVNFSC